jgi:cell division septation protein DedD
MTPQEQPMPEPVEQAVVETSADQSDAQDSKAPPAFEPPPAQPETTAAPTAEPEPENQMAQQDSPDQMSMEQPALSEQGNAPNTSEPEPENQIAQQDPPDQMSMEQPALSGQGSTPSTSGPEPAAKQAARPKQSADAQFTIQVGAYRNKNYAEDAMALLSRKGYEAYIFEDTDAKSRTWHMVRFGHYPTRQAARWALDAYQDKERKKAIIARAGVR